MAVGVGAAAAVARAAVAAATASVGCLGHRTCTHGICSGCSALWRTRLCTTARTLHDANPPPPSRRRRVAARTETDWEEALEASAQSLRKSSSSCICKTAVRQWQNARVTSSKAERATQSTERNAEHKGGEVEPMHGCGWWRTVQCCACSLSALHQLLHCSMELSCGFAGLQLTGADLGEAELRAWVPTSMASPQAARNVKAGA